jgi:hypothetical protein
MEGGGKGYDMLREGGGFRTKIGGKAMSNCENNG